MPVSANTLFHFTKFETLEKILSSQSFWPKYSLEHFEHVLSSRSSYAIAYIPMVCFCDLKLTQLSDESISQHTLDFGNFGIGFKKTWGIRNNISPVVYVHKKSVASKTIINTINQINKSSITNDKNLVRQLGEIVKFLKPYDGYYQKGTKRRNPINYYDEREWRYIPKESKFVVFPHKQVGVNKIELLNRELQQKPLRFKPNDIKYIIVDNENKKQPLAKTIENLNIQPSEKVNLITKIISLKEIKEDF
ncbi:MAG: abortive infection system antitoxin AbiGi family protein [Flavobacterium sp.]|nr:abortive infection system antitoxin AbiGi family protein [Flavobacterium sp.]